MSFSIFAAEVSSGLRAQVTAGGEGKLTKEKTAKHC